MRRAAPLLAVFFLFAPSCFVDDPLPLAPAYSEERAACAERDPLRKAYFGDLHVHTTLSFDAWTYDVRAAPPDAYRFARGETIHLPPLDENGAPTFAVSLARPLDFAAVTDHVEYLGETHLCITPGSPAYDSPTCKAYRPPAHSYLGFNVGSVPPVRADMCGEDASVCLAAAAPIWRSIQDAAEAAYDRTAACSFTTFVAYEYSYAPFGTNLHRNVIFRNAKALSTPIGFYEAPTPPELWKQLAAACDPAKNGCDVLAIPHNSNLSNGQMFAVEHIGVNTDEERRDFDRLRASMEPLVEVYQHKGDSECTNGLTTTLGAPDELCDFEKMQKPASDCGVDGTGSGAFAGLGCTSWRDFVRGVLASGMQEEAKVGVNPYKLGIIASTDTHNGTPGNVGEARFPGHLGMSDNTPELQLGGATFATRPLMASPGGLAGVWAEENSRDSIFDALRRRETFGTSGPRITLRVFAGWDYPDDLCARADMVSEGYRTGVPMGADLPARPEDGGAPQIVAAAMRDAGVPGDPGAKLQRVQVIKIWVDPDGTPHEKVFDVAGDAKTGADLDTATCTPSTAGADALCTVWRRSGVRRRRARRVLRTGPRSAHLPVEHAGVQHPLEGSAGVPQMR
ncbi:MAG: DUF3604 domain-containing protein [Minicystis sp.]